ncbi:MAG: choice-of-anchor L domain-containing protein [Bacteroidales bacterium]|nr:choice-of-anchor L domain-containing protein [Bacteroidales bacterium]MCF8455539.1 choice-of-anchor L domain-containing protein [Bacteroidales bacterium]
MKRTSFTILGTFLAYTAFTQLVISGTSNYQQLVNNFILTGVSASNVVYTGDTAAIGSFSNGATTNIGMSDGILLTTGVIDSTPPISSPPSNFLSTFNGTDGDSLLNVLISGYPTHDASVLEFDLVPVGNILEFQYVFASEEYPEYAGSAFNDVFGFFISGQDPLGGSYANQNITLIPGTSSVVSINNVNATTNATYYIDNQAVSPGTIAFDGFTTVLLAQLSVVVGQTYHLKMAVADVADGIFDSAIFLKAQSMKSYSTTGIDESAEQLFTIPNPLKSGNEISFNFEKSGTLTIQLFDYSGREISTTSRKIDSPGTYSINANDVFGNSPIGLYFLSTTFYEKRQTVKLFWE